MLTTTSTGDNAVKLYLDGEYVGRVDVHSIDRHDGRLTVHMVARGVTVRDDVLVDAADVLGHRPESPVQTGIGLTRNDILTTDEYAQITKRATP